MGLSQGAKERRRRDFGAVHATASEELWVSKDVRSRGAETDAACLLHACPMLCTAMHMSPSTARPQTTNSLSDLVLISREQPAFVQLLAPPGSEPVRRL